MRNNSLSTRPSRLRFALAALVLTGLTAASSEAEARRRSARHEPAATASIFDFFKVSASEPQRKSTRERRVARRSQPAATPSPSLTPALSGGGSTGVASYYHEGQRTASGERFNPSAMTAAHRSAPFGSQMRVTNLNNGRSVVVRINDRGPFVRGRIIDVSQGAAQALGFISAGVAKVRIEPAT